MKIDLTNAEAKVLHLYLKRANFSDYRRRATSDDEAYTMQYAAVKLRSALIAHDWSSK